MGRASGNRITRRKRSPAPRLARESAASIEAQRLLKVWRRVLERRLRSRLHARVAVEIHDNTHTMVTFQRERGKWRLRLHHMFLAAADDVLTALAAYVRAADPQSSVALDRFIERNRAFIRKVPPAQLRKRLRIEPKGEHHDLERIFNGLNIRYFDNRVSATITYGPAPKGRRPRKSIKMGSYSAHSKVIRIHPALDQALVPRYFVEWIVFHEMLHAVHPVITVGRRRLFHSREFMAHERTFHEYARARDWERRNLDRLLTY